MRETSERRYLVIQRRVEVILHPSSLLLREFAMGDPEDDEDEEEEKKKWEDEEEEDDDDEEEEETWQVEESIRRAVYFPVLVLQAAVSSRSTRRSVSSRLSRGRRKG
jgi:hypothetical protein